MRHVALLAIMLVAAAAPGQGVDPRTKGVTTPHRYGFYDPERKLVGIRLDDGSPATFVLDGGFKFFMDGRPATLKQLADLPATAMVRLKLNDDKTVLLALDVIGPSITATIESVDAAKRTVTVKLSNGMATYEVEKDARITRGATDLIDLGQVKAGDPAFLFATIDTKRIRGILVRTGKE